MAKMIRTGVQTAILLAGILVLRAHAAPPACPGDCNNNGILSASEIQKIIFIINLCDGVPAGCPAVPGGADKSCVSADFNTNGSIGASELQRAINNINAFPDTNGCPPLAATATPTLTPIVNTPTLTPSPTLVPTGTFTPTLTFTVPPPPSATATATATQTASQTPTNTVVAALPCGGMNVPASKCCNNVVDAGEDCDLGGTCSGGSNALSACTNNSTCPGGECRAFGGKGCAENCTTEKAVTFNFSGAQCFGPAANAKTGKACTFQMLCTGGPSGLVGKPCSLSSECGAGGTCSDECATKLVSGVPTATNDKAGCRSVGFCSAGDAGLLGIANPFVCPADSKDAGLAQALTPSRMVKLCTGGTSPGVICTGSGAGTCTGTNAVCANPCSPSGSTGVCRHRSGAVLEAANLAPLNIGPFTGSQIVRYGKPDPVSGIIPIAIRASDVIFAPVSVPNLACACPHGAADPTLHGPGNSASGMIGCGATGIINPNVVLASDHNTSPNDPDNGPGTCSGGTLPGLACGIDTDCGTGGTCVGGGGKGGVCVGGGSNEGKVCHVPSDCPGVGAICNSPDDTTGNCSLVDPPPPNGSGRAACLETKEICFGGGSAGKACTADLDCGGSPATCGNDCNTQGVHPGICNSPTHLTLSGGTSVPGTGLLVTTTAIGVIGPPGDSGGCSKSALCVPFAFGTNPTACVVNADCTSGHTCSTAYCGGRCASGDKQGQGCGANTDCGGGTCVSGLCSNANIQCTMDAQCGPTCGTGNPAVFGTACAGATCGPDNVCFPVNVAKGIDGLPCTADDPLTSQGVGQPIPTTTSMASASVVDVSANKPSPGLMYGPLCDGKVPCETGLQGVPFNCANLNLATPSVAGVSVVSAFTQIDSATTGDTVITNRQTAK